MTRDEAIKELNSISISSDFNFNRVVSIIMENAARRVQYKKVILTRREEEVLIEYLYSMGAEDRYVEDRVAASAFFYHYRTLQLTVEELEYIKAILEKNKRIYSLYSTLYGSRSFTDISHLENNGLREAVAELYETHQAEVLIYYDQTRLSLQNVKIKVRELEEILKHYLSGINEFKQMIIEQKKNAQTLTKSIIKLSKDIEREYNFKAPKEPNHLRSYSDEILDREALNTNISELLNI